MRCQMRAKMSFKSHFSMSDNMTTTVGYDAPRERMSGGAPSADMFWSLMLCAFMELKHRKRLLIRCILSLALLLSPATASPLRSFNSFASSRPACMPPLHHHRQGMRRPECRDVPSWNAVESAFIWRCGGKYRFAHPLNDYLSSPTHTYPHQEERD